ncbi:MULTISPECIES: phospholipid scramblase-related protein [Labilibaculum]|uniref:RNAase n=1 Tax=Labilibaculum euxinus TaxID=2686357 RepID=A0A7M4D9V3_9BACT|nr:MULTISPECIES: phospholipid scramblase-related protein [Labilibaculum]MDM8161046.1 phospholipid scramblase-related protein [Labilibaculum sp. K2S]MUP39432.1 RNAase [Labilibaculum euxinus]MVB08637.1 RNAase [Labilibaculum euxinus]
MNPILSRNSFFVKEHVGMFKAANNFDIFNPENQEMIMTCREEKLGFFTKMLRFTDYKRMTPFNIEIKTVSGEKVLTIKRGVSFFLSTVEVFDENDNLLGKFKQKFFSIGGKFDVIDSTENILCTLKGKWTSWDFKFSKGETEFAHVSKKWAGIGKELFTSADNYMLTIDEKVTADNPMRVLILAAVMCIDMVLKE